MKMRSILMIICLFIGATSIQLSAQSINRSSQGWAYPVFETPVFCDGVMVDYVRGTVKCHWVAHYKDGWIWEIDQAKGEGISMKTGELFRYKETDKISYVEGIVTWKYNLKGNMGNHYIGTITMDMSTWEIIEVGHTVCN